MVDQRRERVGVVTQRITGASPSECPACHGLGYTGASQAEMETRWNRERNEDVEVRTLRQGSGCLRCGGMGQLP